MSDLTSILTTSELEELQAEVIEVLEHLQSIDYLDAQHTAEQIGIAKHLLNKLVGTIESYK